MCVGARASFFFLFFQSFKFSFAIIYLILSIFVFLFQLYRSYASYIIMNNRFLYIHKIYIKNYICNIAKIIIIEKNIVFKMQKKKYIWFCNKFFQKFNGLNEKFNEAYVNSKIFKYFKKKILITIIIKYFLSTKFVFYSFSFFF